MRLALFALIVLVCGCIPSPSKPLGAQKSEPDESAASLDGAVAAVVPVSSDQPDGASQSAPTPKPFSLAPAPDESRDAKLGIVELSPDNEVRNPDSRRDSSSIDSASASPMDFDPEEDEAPVGEPKPFSLAAQPSEERRSPQTEHSPSVPGADSEIPGSNNMLHIANSGKDSDAATDFTPLQLGDPIADSASKRSANPASIAELAESAADEFVDRAGQAVESAMGSLLPQLSQSPLSADQPDRAPAAGQKFASASEMVELESRTQTQQVPGDGLRQESVGAISLAPSTSKGLGDESGPSIDSTPQPPDSKFVEQPVSRQQAGRSGRADPTRLIPREVLFGAPQRARPRLSPDGRRLAYLAPKNGVLNIWVAPIDQIDSAVPLTNRTDHDIRNFFWAYTNEHLVYSHDERADQNYHVFSIDVRNGKVKDLTPIAAVSARIESVSDRFPSEVLVGINDRAPHRYHDLYRVHLLTGQRQLVLENPGFASLLADDDYQVRFAVSYTPDGGQMIVQQDDRDPRGWSAYLKIDPDDAMTTSIVGFDKSGDRIYLRDSRERDTSALRLIDLNTNQQATLAENRFADVGGVMIHPSEKHVEAVTFDFERPEWQVLDEQLLPDFEYLASVADGDVQIASRTLDDGAWIVAYTVDDGPIRYYHYQREPREATLLFTSNSDLLQQPLVPMNPVVIKSRDGLNLVSYYSLPNDSDPTASGKPTAPLPLVLDVHGGPWARDAWGFDPVHQLLANRGYAVLSVNFRGSTGFGKTFVNAADGEWAGKMHNDLLDAVQWAVQQGIADRNRIGIMGGSYGGYATLVGLSFTPAQFACGIDIGGPANLETLLANPPSHWQPMMPLLHRRIATIDTEQGQHFARTRSPLTMANRISSPLLIAEPATGNDVQRIESEQIVRLLKRQQVPVTHLAFPADSLGLAAPANRLAFYAVAEAFLAEHLGGRYQPIEDLMRHADVQVPVGSEQIPGLRVALGDSARRESALSQPASERRSQDTGRF